MPVVLPFPGDAVAAAELVMDRQQNVQRIRAENERPMIMFLGLECARVRLPRIATLSLASLYVQFHRTNC